MAGKVSKKGSVYYLNIGNHWYQYDERTKPLGAGAMGVVYKGYDSRTGEMVAIKRVLDKYANIPEIRRRAHQEADLMFRHPNLVEMLGCCELSAGYGPIFIVSRFVHGENIDSFINNYVRSLPHAERRICELFFPVLDALSYIHSKGIIHMDIKPSNIMMESGRNVRLMDLGIADISNTVNGSSSGMMGTPKYAAPEQFSDIDRKLQLTPATDIYEAGVTLYELLTMQNPFAANSVAEAKQLHQGTILQPTPQMSQSVYQVLLKATDIDASQRFQRASEMKKALEQALRTPDPVPSFIWIYILVGVIGAILLLVLLILVLLK